MRKELKPIRDAMAAILADPRSNRIERIEAAKVILSCHGVLLPDVDESFLSVRQLTQLRAWKRQTVEKVLKRKEQKRLQNKRNWLRRKIRAAQEGEK